MTKKYKPGRALTGKIEHREFHPVSAAFPLITGMLFERLTESIRCNGLREPIKIDADGRVVDGRARYLACAELGIEPATEVLGDNESLAFVSADLNACRRDLTKTQRYEAFERLLPVLEAEARERERRGTLVSNDTRVGRTREALAAMLGVSEGTVARATKVVKRAHPKVTKLMVDGEISPSLAAKVADLPQEQQAAVVESQEPKEAAKAAVKVEQESKPEAWPKDGRDQEIPSGIAPVFASKELDGLKRLTDKLRREIERVGQLPEGAYLDNDVCAQHLRAVAARIKTATPYIVCPECGGDRCRACINQGWMTKERLAATGRKIEVEGEIGR